MEEDEDKEEQQQIGGSLKGNIGFKIRKLWMGDFASQGESGNRSEEMLIFGGEPASEFWWPTS